MGFGENETCPIFYHKWVSKRPLVHLLAQKFRFKMVKSGQIWSKLIKLIYTQKHRKSEDFRCFVGK